MRRLLFFAISIAVALMLAGVARAGGPVHKAKNAVDPDCGVGKAAKGAVERSTVGVGNRCKPAETARDAVGIDKKKQGKGDGPLK